MHTARMLFDNNLANLRKQQSGGSLTSSGNDAHGRDVGCDREGEE